MKALVETWRGGRAILRWAFAAPLMTYRAGSQAKSKSEARTILINSFDRLRKSCGIKIVIHGTPPKPNAGCVVCYNETTFADVFVFPSVVLPHVDRAAAADAYALIPFARRACQNAGIELVPRGKRGATENLMATIVEALKNGERIAWGGEGRLSGKDEVGRFKRGASLIAIRAGVPVIPVAFYGGYQRLPMGSLRVRPGTVHVHFGEPIESTGYTEDTVRDLADHTQAIVAKMYADLKIVAGD